MNLGSLVKGLGGLAENLVQGLTGSEALGDIAKIATNFATGNVLGVGEGAFDLADNVGKGLGKLASGIWGAAKDAVKEFSNPGRIKPPARQKAKPLGYKQLQAQNKALKAENKALKAENTALKGGAGGAGGVSGPGQVGGGAGGISGPGQVPKQFTPSFIDDPVKAHGDGADAANLNAILNDPSLSLESKIMMLLMALQAEERKNMKNEMAKMSDAYSDKVKLAGNDDPKASAQNEKNMYEAQGKLQDAQNKISELSNMLTNMMKTWHDTKMATIGNIR